MSLFTANVEEKTTKFPKTDKDGHIKGFGRASWTKIHLVHVRSGQRFHFTLGRKHVSFTDSRDKESLSWPKFRRVLIDLIGDAAAESILTQLPTPEVVKIV